MFVFIVFLGCDICVVRAIVLKLWCFRIVLSLLNFVVVCFFCLLILCCTGVSVFGVVYCDDIILWLCCYCVLIMNSVVAVPLCTALVYYGLVALVCYCVILC